MLSSRFIWFILISKPWEALNTIYSLYCLSVIKGIVPFFFFLTVRKKLDLYFHTSNIFFNADFKKAFQVSISIFTRGN